METEIEIKTEVRRHLQPLVRCECRVGWKQGEHFINDLEVALERPRYYGGKMRVESCQNIATPYDYVPVPDVITAEPLLLETQKQIAARLLASNTGDKLMLP
jgi:hypothetical protein